jgi:hypothetical protein
MMVWQMNAPLRLRNRLHALMDLAMGCDALTILVSSKNIDASIGRIPYQTENTLVTQAPPDESTCPGTSIGALGKVQAIFGKALDNRVRAAGLLKQPEYQLHGAAYLVIGIQDDAAVIVIAQADGQWEAQLTLLRLVEFASLEAAAQEVQFGLCHRTFETKYQAVVEVARVVAAIGVDHERMGERAQLEQAMVLTTSLRITTRERKVHFRSSL